MKIILSTLSTMSLLFLQIKHPMAMGLVLLVQTVIISMMSGLMSEMFWFPYIMTLMFLGGMLVLFIYVTSIASNEMFSLSMMTTVSMSITFIVLIIMMSTNSLEIINQESKQFMLMNNNTSDIMLKLYNKPTNMINMMMAAYLFITLIAVIKITENYKGPLRKMK
nr:NADH dehydrogenase subunit 6 [Sorineuchora shanensis]